jgi:hypothetical protein
MELVCDMTIHLEMSIIKSTMVEISCTLSASSYLRIRIFERLNPSFGAAASSFFDLLTSIRTGLEELLPQFTSNSSQQLHLRQYHDAHS